MTNSGPERTDAELLSSRQRRFLAALVTESTVDAAAKRAGISKTTAYQWRQLPAFLSALRDVELTALQDATRSLLALSAKAIATLESVLDDPDASPAARVRAADSIVSHLLKLRESIDVEMRLAQLEQRLELAGGPR